METKDFSFAEALRFGWEATKRHFGTFAGILLLGMVVSAFQARVGNPTLNEPFGSGWLESVLLNLAGLFVTMGLWRLALRAHDGGVVRFGDAFAEPALFWSFLGATVLYGLAVAAGLILLIVPGVILAVRLAFYGLVAVDEKLGPLAALRRSAALTAGQTGRLLLFGLLLMLVNIGGALALGIGLFATIPSTAVAAVYAYRRLGGAGRVAEAPHQTAGAARG